MTLEKAIAIVLKKNRLECELSQEELAHLCEIDRTYISLLEREKRKPTLNIIFKICESLNMRTSEFIIQVEKLMNGN